VNWFVVSGRVDRGACYSFSAERSAHSGRQYDWVLASQCVLYRHLLCYLVQPCAIQCTYFATQCNAWTQDFSSPCKHVLSAVIALVCNKPQIYVRAQWHDPRRLSFLKTLS